MSNPRCPLLNHVEYIRLFRVVYSWSILLLFIYYAPPRGVLSDTAIRPSVCPSPRRAAALGYRHARCLAMCELLFQPGFSFFFVFNPGDLYYLG